MKMRSGLRRIGEGWFFVCEVCACFFSGFIYRHSIDFETGQLSFKVKASTLIEWFGLNWARDIRNIN